jgi:soluble lytic murein transglycosylase-like protein
MLVVSLLFSFPVYNIPLDYQYQKELFQECKKYNITYELALAVIEVESDYSSNKTNAQSKGLFQLNSDTYPWIAKELGIDQ